MRRGAKKTARMKTGGRPEASANPDGGGGDNPVPAEGAAGQGPPPPG